VLAVIEIGLFHCLLFLPFCHHGLGFGINDFFLDRIESHITDRSFYTRGLFSTFICHFEDNLHVVVNAVATLPGAKITRTGGGDEVVTLASLKLNRVRLGREGSEGDGEEPLPGGLRAEPNDPGAVREDPAGVVLLLVHVVDHVSLHRLILGIFVVLGADNVDGVILVNSRGLVHIDDVVRVGNEKYWIGCVPIKVRKDDVLSMNQRAPWLKPNQVNKKCNESFREFHVFTVSQGHDQAAN